MSTGNSYERVIPGYWAGAYKSCGFEDREAPFEFARLREAVSNFEIKSLDGNCNVYLALGTISVSGFHGIKKYGIESQLQGRVRSIAYFIDISFESASD